MRGLGTPEISDARIPHWQLATRSNSAEDASWQQEFQMATSRPLLGGVEPGARRSRARQCTAHLSHPARRAPSGCSKRSADFWFRNQKYIITIPDPLEAARPRLNAPCRAPTETGLTRPSGSDRLADAEVRWARRIAGQRATLRARQRRSDRASAPAAASTSR